MSPDEPLAVLVVDDLADSAESLRDLLALSGMDARAARSRAEAVGAVAGGFAPDAVVADLWLDDGDGCDLVGELRRELPDAVLFVAVSGVPGQAERCRAAGFAHYLLKPADPAALVALLRREAAPRVNATAPVGK